ncbi:MAG TPA: AMP-binding protein [Povalibacter sp.]|uniref:AMP-binding protein n=1 Tax=Povalibacter sp. TaxID=1962978 RepID=UPI002D0CC8A4|nr:AMP-binding protein [Povalibacter sp.]HMN43635.1 AMP-binding protein [Povalibacter sp.]
MSSNTPQGRKLIAGRAIRWNEARASLAYERGLWIRRTIADSLREAAQHTPERIVLVDGDVHMNCRTLYAQANTMAQAMLSRTPAGSVVSFLLPNWHEAAVIYMASTLAGMIVNPILPSMRDRELQFILEDANTRLVFVPAIFRRQDYTAMLSRVCAQLASPPEVVVLRGDDTRGHTPYESLLQPLDPARELPALNPDAVRMIMYTSGTTGRSKGVLHTHNTLHALISQIREHWLVEPGDKFLVPSPISHIGGSIYAFETPLLGGTTAVLMETWNADEAVKLIDAEKCTHMAGATPFLQQILAAARAAGTRLPSLKLFVCGGASVPPALIRDAAGYFDRAVVTRVYGSTEVPITTVGATRRDEARYGADTDGRTGLADIKLVDHNNAAAAGEGEICARGPQMLVGYLHPEDDIPAFDAEGYFRTGDLARRVDEHYVVVTGRAKDIIIRNGENISPKEVEDILVGHPHIAEIAIVGVPDPRTGERACAVIVPKQHPGPDVASLGAFLDEHRVAKFKIPEQVVLVESLPKNDAGKVLKHQLRATLSGK